MRRSTWLILALGLAVAPGIACFGLGSTEQAVTGVEVTKPWKDMDLPLGGGEVTRSESEDLMVLFHEHRSEDVASVHQRWLTALKQHGYVVTRESPPADPTGMNTVLTGPAGVRTRLFVGGTMSDFRDGQPDPRHEAVSVQVSTFGP